MVGGLSAFGELLVRHRRAAGLTQEALAEASGMSARALLDLERGRAQSVQRRSAEVLADALRLAGADREVFLSVASEGRRRGGAGPAPSVLSTLPPALPDLVGRAGSARHARGRRCHRRHRRAARDRQDRARGVGGTPGAGEVPGRVLRGRPAWHGRPVTAHAALERLSRALAGLEAVRWLWLDPLADSAAVDLLATIVGPERVAGEPAASAELVALCGNLPLAVRIAGNRLASRPHWSVAHLTARLGDERVRLGSLSVGDLQVRSAFEPSYRGLSPAARAMFRRLAAVPGADFGVELAGVATGLAEPDARRYLDELADASLLLAGPDGRVQFHDLIGIFARERWESEEEPAERERVTRAVLTHLLDTASAAGRTFVPEHVASDGFWTTDEAGEWLMTEESGWLAAMRVAARLGWHREVLDLGRALQYYGDVRWLGLPWDRIFQLGVDAARALADRPAEAEMLNYVGWAMNMCLVDREAALAIHREALAVALDAGHVLEESVAHAHLGVVLMRMNRLDEALDHARKASESAEPLGFWTERIQANNRLGRVLYTMGRHEEALAVYRAVLAEADEHTDAEPSDVQRLAVALVEGGIGLCLLAVGEWHAAAALFGRLRQVYLAVNSPGTAASAAVHEGEAWLAAGEYAQARDCLSYALETYGDAVGNDRREHVLELLSRLPEE